MGRAHIAALLLAASFGAGSARADDEIPPVTGGQTWTQHLITAAKAMHPGVVSIVAQGRRADDKADVILGSTENAATVFRPADGVADNAMASGKRPIVRVPYQTSTHHRIGTLAVTFAAGTPPARAQAIAAAIAAGMAPKVLSVKNAADPFPWDPRFGAGTRAQQLTDAIIAKNPDILVMMIHATPPQGGPNVVIGSNIGRLGKVADEDDLRIINTGATNLEVAGEGDDRFETAMPLRDASGKQIGALGIVFPLKPGADKEAIHTRGRAIRDDLATRIPNAAALFARAR